MASMRRRSRSGPVGAAQDIAAAGAHRDALSGILVLLVEDDNLLGDGIRAGLKLADHAVDWVRDGEAARLALLDINRADLEATAAMVRSQNDQCDQDSQCELCVCNVASEVEVDLSAVGEIDSAGVQLMGAAKREAALRQKALRFSGHSPTVIDVLELCKLCSHLGDPLLICSQA